MQWAMTKQVSLVLMVMVLALMLAACGGGSSSNNTSGSGNNGAGSGGTGDTVDSGTTGPTAISLGTSAKINVMVRDSDGSLYIGGNFALVGEPVRSMLTLDGTTAAVASPFPAIVGEVYAVAGDGSGGWYIGGNISSVGGLARGHLAHVLADGSVDPSWHPNVNQVVHTLIYDGTAVYVGGSFTSVNGAAVSRNRLAAFNLTDGTATAWNPDVNFDVLALAYHGSTIYAGGKFTQVNINSTMVPRNHLAAFNNTDGAALAWDPNASAAVRALLVDGNTLYVGGDFIAFNNNTVGRNLLAAFSVGNATPTSWQPISLSDVSAGYISALASDGTKVYAGGSFQISTDFDSLNNLAAFAVSDGTRNNWNPNIAGPVHSLALANNTVYVGGEFDFVNGATVARKNIAAFSTSSSSASAWAPNLFGGAVKALAIDADRVCAGGGFFLKNAVKRSAIAKIQPDGRLDPSFDASILGNVYAMVIKNGVVYVGGEIYAVNQNTTQVARSHLAAFSSTDGVVTAWDPNPDNIVRALASDGNTIYAGGDFTTVNGATLTRNHLAAFNLSTGAATAWDPNVNGVVNTVLLQGTSLYAGGAFDLVNQSGTALTRNRLAAFSLSDGLALAWDPDIADPYTHVNALISDGASIYAGGNFISVNQPRVARPYLAAFDIDTGEVSPWNPSINQVVYTLATDGTHIFAGGNFSNVNIGYGGLLDSGLVRAGAAAFAISDGTATAWDPDVAGSVHSLLPDSSNIIVGGYFFYVDGLRLIRSSLVNTAISDGMAY